MWIYNLCFCHYRTRQENKAKGLAFLRAGNRQQAVECFQKCVDITPEMALEVIKVCLLSLCTRWHGCQDKLAAGAFYCLLRLLWTSVARRHLRTAKSPLLLFLSLLLLSIFLRTLYEINKLSPKVRSWLWLSYSPLQPSFGMSCGALLRAMLPLEHCETPQEGAPQETWMFWDFFWFSLNVGPTQRKQTKLFVSKCTKSYVFCFFLFLCF